VLDAKKGENGTAVCIKRITPKIHVARTEEVEIGRYLSTEHMLGDPTNHCVPILDFFPDPVDPQVEYIVMPLLRPYDDPAMGVVGEVVDFVTQILEVSAKLSYVDIHLNYPIRAYPSCIAIW
jgi:hypothetical protein